MTRRQDLIDAIRARIGRVTSGPDGVLAQDGEAEAATLADLAYHAKDDLEAAYVLAAWHWWRHSLLEDGSDQVEYRAAVVWFCRVFPLRPDLVPAPLHSMVAQIAEPSGATTAERNAEAVRLMADPQANSNPDVLDRVVRLLDKPVDEGGLRAAEFAMRLSNLGIALLRRYDARGRAEDLARAVRVLQQSLSMTPADDPYRATRLAHLGQAQASHYELTGDPAQLDVAVQTLAGAVGLAPTDNPDRAAILSALADAYAARFTVTDALADLYRAVTTGEDAVAALPADAPARPGVLARLTVMLQTRYDRAGVAPDLDRAIEVGIEAVAGTGSDLRERARRRTALGRAFVSRYHLTGLVDGLNQSIVEFDAALADAPGDPVDRAEILVALGSALVERFHRTRVIGDLDRAASVREEALALARPDDPARPDRLVELAAVLSIRFERIGVLADLDEAVRLCGEAIVAAPVTAAARPGYLLRLASTLSERFDRTGSVDDLDRAVDAAEQAVATTTEPDPEVLSAMQRLFAARFDLKEAAADLERSIAVGEQAVALTPAIHPDRSRRLWALSDALATRFTRLGDRTDLERAIAMGEAASEGPEVPDPESTVRLAAHLRTRYVVGGVASDLNRAIELIRTVVVADDPDRSGRLAVLADMLAQRYERSGTPADLDAAIEAAEASLAVTVAPHPERRRRLCDLANLIRRRTAAHPRDSDIILIDRAIQIADEAASRSSASGATIGPSGARCERALLLRLRYDRSGDAADLDQAIVALTSALVSLAIRDPYRGRCLYALGTALRTRFGGTTGATADAEAALDVLREATASDVAPAGLRLRAAVQWATFAADRGEWNQAAAAWESVMTVEVPDTPRGELVEWLDPAGRLALLSDAGSAAAAAALGVGDVGRAWRLFDHGRQLVRRLSGWGGPESTVDDDGVGGTEVVVNLTRWRCDVLTRGESGQSFLPLPYLTAAEMATRAAAVRAAVEAPSRAASRIILDTTTWLWDTVVGPVLDHIGHTTFPAPGRWPRVRWQPVGAVAGLPLHAAGRPAEPGKSTVDRVVSSYPADLPYAHPGPGSRTAALWSVEGELGPAIGSSVASGTDPALAVHHASRRQRARYPYHPYLWAAYVHIGH